MSMTKKEAENLFERMTKQVNNKPKQRKEWKHVYLGLGINRFRVVGILIAGIFYLFVYEKLKQRA